MAGRSYKTEAIVLRSFRLGEADRVLHLYTLERGRVGAVAKGIRRTKSRFGGRLEPLSHVQAILHQEGSATIYVSDVPPGHADFAAVQWWGTAGGLHGLAPAFAKPGHWPLSWADASAGVGRSDKLMLKMMN